MSGQTLADLNATLQNRYKEFFINPQVVAEFVMEESPDAVSPWGSVTVLGRVMTPGRVDVPPTQDLTLSAAIQQADFDPAPRTTAIQITRPKADGETERITVDFQSARQAGQPGKRCDPQAGRPDLVPERSYLAAIRGAATGPRQIRGSC